jgi:hypothetical protein
MNDVSQKGGATYRVTATAGGWRSLPWPFGLLDVTDKALQVRSWHWSWWLADRAVPREAIESIKVRWSIFGVATLAITNSETKRPIRVTTSVAPLKLVSDLKGRGYPVTEIGRPPRPSWIRGRGTRTG